MQSWFSFDLDGEICRVEKEDTNVTLAAYLSRLDPCFAHHSDHHPHLQPRLVVMGTLEGDRHRFRVVDSGLILLPMLVGRQIWTPEGIRNAEPDHPVNMAYQNGHFECSAERLDPVIALTFEGYYRPDMRRQGQINDQFDSIVTRTANVPAIRDAASQVFASTETLRREAARRAERSGEETSVWTGRKDIFGDRFTKQLFRLPAQKSFQYVGAGKHRFFRPDTLVELIKLKREYPESRFVSGGTSLAGAANGHAFPSLISLEGVSELNSLFTTEEHWEIGAAVSLTQIAEHIGRECPAFNKILRRFASRPLRNRATLGGYLANAWPSGQLSPLLMALNARVILISGGEVRDAPVSQFFSGKGATILKPGELIRSVIIPRSSEAILAARGITSRLIDVYTVATRRTFATPYATGAFAIELRDRKISKAWLAYSGIAAFPGRAREAEEFLVGRNCDENTLIATLPVLHKCLDAEAQTGLAVEP